MSLPSSRRHVMRGDGMPLARHVNFTCTCYETGIIKRSEFVIAHHSNAVLHPNIFRRIKGGERKRERETEGTRSRGAGGDERERKRQREREVSTRSRYVKHVRAREDACPEQWWLARGYSSGKRIHGRERHGNIRRALPRGIPRDFQRLLAPRRRSRAPIFIETLGSAEFPFAVEFWHPSALFMPGRPAF